MDDIDHAAILRQHADTRRRGHSVNPEVLRAAAAEIERLRAELVSTTNKLTAERDEARRLYCIAFQEITENLGEKNTTESIAEEMGWDCFKGNTDD